MLAQKIKDLRISLGMTQKDLSEKSRLSRSFICHVELGTRTDITAVNLYKIAKVFNKPMEYFLDTGQ